MLIAGGVDDQPAGRWLARNQAGSIWQHLERTSAKGFEFATLNESERALTNRIRKVDVDDTEPEWYVDDDDA